MTPLLGDKTPPEVKAWTLNKYGPRLAYLDAKLKDREFLLDRFSVADGYLTTVLNWTRATPQIDLTVYPNELSRADARPPQRRKCPGDGDSAVPGGSRAAQGRLRRPSQATDRGLLFPVLALQAVSLRLRAWPAISTPRWLDPGARASHEYRLRDAQPRCQKAMTSSRAAKFSTSRRLSSGRADFGGAV